MRQSSRHFIFSLATMLGLAAAIPALAVEEGGGLMMPDSEKAEMQSEQRQFDRDNKDGKVATVADVKIIREVRQTLLTDKSLSVAARRIDIVVNNGAVSLSGDVESLNERQEIENMVASVDGVKSVSNNLDVREAH